MEFRPRDYSAEAKLFLLQRDRAEIHPLSVQSSQQVQILDLFFGYLLLNFIQLADKKVSLKLYSIHLRGSFEFLLILEAK